MCRLRLRALLCVLILAAASATNFPSAFSSTIAALPAGAVLLDIPPRFQWGWRPTDKGYCGEASVQSAALQLGNWISQELVYRADGNSEFLLGTPNARRTATALGLSFDEWDSANAPQPQGAAFMAWAKVWLDTGAPVVAGFYQAVNQDKDYDVRDRVVCRVSSVLPAISGFWTGEN